MMRQFLIAPPACAALLAAALVAVPAAAQPADGGRALAQLFQNVNFWSQKGQPEMAMRELDKVLVLAPNDPDALALAARLAYQNGQFEAGNRYREQLRRVAPADPRLTSLSAERPLSPADLQVLANARALATAGKKDEAVRAYRQLFHGAGVPDSLAVEYYLAYGTLSHDAYQEAVQKLGEIAARWPNDASFKLAIAQLMTYDEAGRADGIDMLAQLAQNQSVAAGAKAAWHDALLWQGLDQRTVDQINTYIKAYGSDPQLDARLKEAQQELPDPGTMDRIRAYQALSGNDLAQASTLFENVLKQDPQDAKSMIMLAIVRRQQHRDREADDLVRRAFAMAPDQHDDFVKTLGYDPAAPRPAGGPVGGPGGQGADPAAAAAIRRQYAHVSYLTDRGEYAQAEAELRRLAGARPNTGSLLQLGYIQLRAGELAAAEASFKRVLATSPRNANALGGLAGVYSRQGRDAEAQAIYARLGTAPGGPGAAVFQRVQDLRSRAQASADPAEKIRLFREAVAADPAYPWTRLELARLLYAQGQRDEADQVMTAATAGARPSVDQVQAALVWAQEHNQAARIDQLIALLPADRRTPQLAELQQRSAIAADVQRAQGQGAAALLALASQPDPTGERGRLVAAALLRLGDRAAARSAVQQALAATHPPSAAQRLAYAEALYGAGFAGDARNVLGNADAAGLPPQQRQEYNGVADALAAQEADRLAAAGKSAEAYDAIAPRLRQNPDSTALNLAVARIYAAAGRPKQAQRVAEQALQRTPSDLDAQQMAVNTAIQNGELARAGSIADQAVQEAPDDPRVYMMQADVARARGENGAALTALRKARSLRQQQLTEQTQ